MISPKPQLLDWGSKLQIQSIGLRYDVLRKPLNLMFGSKELLEEKNQWHFGLVSGERVVAVLLIKQIEPDIAKMRQVAVAADLQGRGLGKQLVQFAESWCRQNFLRRIELHARMTAVPFYLSMSQQQS